MRGIIILVCLLAVGIPYAGILYEGYMLRSNTRSLGEDVRAMQDSKAGYAPNCTMYYNPFRFLEDRDEQRSRYRNSKLLCED